MADAMSHEDYLYRINFCKETLKNMQEDYEMEQRKHGR